MPRLMAMDGCTGLSMVCDREYGRAIITSAWSTQEGRDASEQMMLAKRQRAAEIFRARPSVDFWDIAVVHRHAPRAKAPGFAAPGSTWTLRGSPTPSTPTG
jgi:hypothetical protein